ncbi:hypothetical protein ACLRE7_02445 [Mycoplasmopsis meleagridis]|uniref:hypothetical protein n=1 Tax=Mycoplasmopsis meleagridis TaxID=29561 RepID=UPI003A83CF90
MTQVSHRYKQFLENNYEEFRRDVVNFNIRRDRYYILFVGLAIFMFTFGVLFTILLAVGIFNYSQTSSIRTTRWVFFSVAVVSIVIAVISLIIVFVRMHKIKNEYFVNSEDMLLQYLYNRVDLVYKGKGRYPDRIDDLNEVFYKSSNKWDSIDWVTDSLMLSGIPSDKNLKFVLGHVFYNEKNKSDKWRIQNIRIGVSKGIDEFNEEQFVMDSYLFLEGKIQSKKFDQSYLFGPKFPLNFNFSMQENVNINLGKSYTIFSDVNNLNEEAYSEILEHVQELDLWNRGFGFYIDKETNKVYSWIKLDREIFKWTEDKYPAHNMLRDAYLIGTLESLPTLLD